MVSFEEQVTVIREALAALHEREEEYTRAAQILAGIDLDSGAGGKALTLSGNSEGEVASSLITRALVCGAERSWPGPHVT